ncbi:hypothetical protein C8J30_101364 [Rhodobacter viridis]|uniref:Uncharacterized protein n=1 Tax=Rhodobacter viridis TaxID=1054202 RepID=A0A318U4K8_9RHOB|nr:hypothetical protein [Rhodobacter viridis]PYF12979.1 hypothetical protein C8J30_101364 [Rhodobacter viridis]
MAAPSVSGVTECDENLCAPNLSASERAVFTARRKAAYEALHPETQAAAFKGNQHVARGQLGHEQKTFSEDQAEKTGQAERSVRRDAERGTKVCEAALDRDGVLQGWSNWRGSTGYAPNS